MNYTWYLLAWLHANAKQTAEVLLFWLYLMYNAMRSLPAILDVAHNGTQIVYYCVFPTSLKLLGGHHIVLRTVATPNPMVHYYGAHDQQSNMFSIISALKSLSLDEFWLKQPK